MTSITESTPAGDSKVPVTPPPKRSIRRFGFMILRMAALIYVGLIVLLMFSETRLIYPRGGTVVEIPGLIHSEDFVPTPDGEKINVWVCPNPKPQKKSPTSSRWVVLDFHGNGGNINHRYENVLKWHKHLGCDVVLFDYRGYGRSSGSPFEQGLYTDGRAVYDWLTNEKGYSPSRFIFVGQSLGGGVAIQLATEKQPAALVLESTFTRLTDAAGTNLPWIPVRWIMRNKYDSIDKIAKYSGPVFLYHGDKDEVVPFAHCAQLFDKVTGPKERFVQPRGLHNDSLPEAYYTAVHKFLRQHAIGN